MTGARSRRAWRRRRRGERGVVTAEIAMGLPLLLAVTVGLVWLLAVGVAQVRVVDAAREAARSAARGDDADTASAAGRHVAPPGSAVEVDHAGAVVTARVSGVVDGPGGLFSFLPDVTVHATATAADESGSTGSTGSTGSLP